MFLLPLFFIIFTSQPVNTYQLQGYHQTVQNTDRADKLQGNEGELNVLQGNQEDGDNLQPAMGYNTLQQSNNGIRLQ